MPSWALLQEHLLKMTTEHRAEMASKRGRPTLPEGWWEVPYFEFNAFLYPLFSKFNYV